MHNSDEGQEQSFKAHLFPAFSLAGGASAVKGLSLSEYCIFSGGVMGLHAYDPLIERRHQEG